MEYHPETFALHADDELDVTNDVAPPLHVASTFRFPSNPEQLVPLRHRSVSSIYLHTTSSLYRRLTEILLIGRGQKPRLRSPDKSQHNQIRNSTYISS